MVFLKINSQHLPRCPVIRLLEEEEKRRDERKQASVRSFSCSRPNNRRSLREPVVQAGRGHAASSLSACEQLGSQLQCCVHLNVTVCATSEVVMHVYIKEKYVER